MGFAGTGEVFAEFAQRCDWIEVGSFHESIPIEGELKRRNFIHASSDSWQRSAARLQTWKEVGKNHSNDCCTKERNTGEPRYEKTVAQKFFGENDDG
jgi:hypothetical protein